MRHWNYRVIKHPRPTPMDEDYYSIHEVFYDDNNAVDKYSAEPCGFGSETLEGLGRVMNMVQEAFNKPVLDAEDLPGYEGK